MCAGMGLSHKAAAVQPDTSLSHIAAAVPRNVCRNGIGLSHMAATVLPNVCRHGIVPHSQVHRSSYSSSGPARCAQAWDCPRKQQRSCQMRHCPTEQQQSCAMCAGMGLSHKAAAVQPDTSLSHIAAAVPRNVCRNGIGLSHMAATVLPNVCRHGIVPHCHIVTCTAAVDPPDVRRHGIVPRSSVGPELAPRRAKLQVRATSPEQM